MGYNEWFDSDPAFKPARKNIASITNASQALVVTTSDHEYLTGTVVRLIIPFKRGMQEANQLTGKITVVDATSFTIDIDTSLMDTFITVLSPALSPNLDICAQVNPIGESNEMLSAATERV